MQQSKSNTLLKSQQYHPSHPSRKATPSPLTPFLPSPLPLPSPRPLITPPSPSPSQAVAAPAQAAGDDPAAGKAAAHTAASQAEA